MTKFNDMVFDKIMGMERKRIIIRMIGRVLPCDVRKIFEHTPEEDAELYSYYSKLVEVESTDRIKKLKQIATAVNTRLNYKTDLINYGKIEKFARPIEVHRKQFDDCDGYAALIVYVARLFGFQPFEVFVWTGVLVDDNGNGGGHASALFYDLEKGQYYVVEGSAYPAKSLANLGVTPIQGVPNYKEHDFIFNDVVSYCDSPWVRLAL